MDRMTNGQRAALFGLLGGVAGGIVGFLLVLAILAVTR